MPKRIFVPTQDKPVVLPPVEPGVHLKNDNGKYLAQVDKEPNNSSSLKMWSGESSDPSIELNTHHTSSFIGKSGETKRLGVNKEKPEHELDVVGEAAISGKFEVGKASLIVHTDSGRVGIGIAKPSELLHVNQGNLKIQNKDGSLFLGHSKEVLFGSIGKSSTMLAQDSPLVIGTRINHDMRLGTNNTSRIIIKNNGNVGVGTTNPRDMLDVHGHINATGFKVNSNVGFSGTGTFTNFTIENGIITKAW